MQFKKETEYQNHTSILLIAIVEALTSGLTLAKDDLDQLDELPAGFLVAQDSNGLGRVIKTAGVYELAGDTDTAIKVSKGHCFKVGQFVMDAAKTGAAVTITAIDISHTDYDTITVDATIGVELAVGAVLVEAAATASAGNGALKYPAPIGVGMSTVDLTKDNQQTGVLVRGTVNEGVLPFPVSAELKALVPLIRFEYSS